eukprot:jgi/Tetstr1/439928/TSEL_028335.t1
MGALCRASGHVMVAGQGPLPTPSVSGSRGLRLPARLGRLHLQRYLRKHGTRASTRVAGLGGWRERQEQREAERRQREWVETQESGLVDAESAFDIEARKCLALYQSFLASPLSRMSAAATGDGESILLTGLFGLFAALFATLVYVVLQS